MVSTTALHPSHLAFTVPFQAFSRRLFNRLPITARGHVVAVIGELIGTTLFLFFAFAGTQVANIASNTNTGATVITTVSQKTPEQLLYISLSFGFSLAVFAWVFFRISGGLFNPAVSHLSSGVCDMRADVYR
jgi:aquaporin related protein